MNRLSLMTERAALSPRACTWLSFLRPRSAVASLCEAPLHMHSGQVLTNVTGHGQQQKTPLHSCAAGVNPSVFSSTSSAE